MPIVSGIITTFNRKHLLMRAIRSVLRQTFRDFELLVLDNASADGTAEAVATFRDPRIRYLPHPPMTIGAARNVGVREASCEYVAFLDDDDEWLPFKLERQVDFLQHATQRVALVYGGFTRIGEDGRELSVYRPTLRGRILKSLLWQRDPFTGSASNPLLRTSAIVEVGGYDNDIDTSEDWELYLRLAEGYEVDFVDDIILRIRSHGGARLGNRVSGALRVEQKVLDRYGNLMDTQLRSFYLQKIGDKMCRVGSVKEGRRWILQAIREDPRNLLAYAQFAVSFLGTTIYGRIHSQYKAFERSGPGEVLLRSLSSIHW